MQLVASVVERKTEDVLEWAPRPKLRWSDVMRKYERERSRKRKEYREKKHKTGERTVQPVACAAASTQAPILALAVSISLIVGVRT